MSIGSAQSEHIDPCHIQQTYEHCILDDILKTDKSCWQNEQPNICCCSSGKGILQENIFRCCCCNSYDGEWSSRQRRRDVNFSELPPDICIPVDCATISKIELINVGRKKTSTLFKRSLPHVSSESLYTHTKEDNSRVESKKRDNYNIKPRKKLVNTTIINNKEISQGYVDSAQSGGSDNVVRRSNKYKVNKANERQRSITESVYENKENSITSKKTASPTRSLRGYPSKYRGDMYRFTGVECGNIDRKKSQKLVKKTGITLFGEGSGKGYLSKNRKQVSNDIEKLMEEKNTYISTEREFNAPATKIASENTVEYGTEFNEVKKQNSPLKETVNLQSGTKRKRLFSCCRKKKKSNPNAKISSQHNASNAVPQSDYLVSKQAIETAGSSNGELHKKKDCFSLCCKKPRRSKRKVVSQTPESDAHYYGERSGPHLWNYIRNSNPFNVCKSECYCRCHCTKEQKTSFIEQKETVNRGFELQKTDTNSFLKKGKKSPKSKCCCRKRDNKYVYRSSEHLEVENSSLKRSRPRESEKLTYKNTVEVESDYYEVSSSSSVPKKESITNKMIAHRNSPLGNSNDWNLNAKISDVRLRLLSSDLSLKKRQTSNSNFKHRSTNRKLDERFPLEETHVYKPSVQNTTSLNLSGVACKDACSLKYNSESDCSSSDNENRSNIMEETNFPQDSAVYNNCYCKHDHIKDNKKMNYIPLDKCIAKYAEVKRNGLQISRDFYCESDCSSAEINQGCEYNDINYEKNYDHDVDCCCPSELLVNNPKNFSEVSFFELQIDLDECDSISSSNVKGEPCEYAQLPQIIEINDDTCDYCCCCELQNSNEVQEIYSNSLNNRIQSFSMVDNSPPKNDTKILDANKRQLNKIPYHNTDGCWCCPSYICTSVRSCEQKKNVDLPEINCCRQRKSLLKFYTARYLMSADFSKLTKKNQPQTDKCCINSKEKATPKIWDWKNSTPPLDCEEGPKSSLHNLSRLCNCSGFVVNMPADNECTDKDCCVRVAVRIRPQNSREKIDMCRVCTAVTPGEPQVILGQDKAFTFDYVFDAECNQNDIYSECVERLVEGALRGYNATVLAYGQTGSGKTFTMGTGFDRSLNDAQKGIIPRAVEYIFAGIESIQSPHFDKNGAHDLEEITFSVAVQFMELYNEDIIDLLDPYSKGNVFKIHEDSNGQISVSGVTIKPIQTPQDALKCLQQGALARTTASTQMNDQSSRSHALFTILIRRQRFIRNGLGLPADDIETLTSKFHFVDLAGSERLKRTGATGERAREGISINCGLLALGNCISALGDRTKKATHIPYRDSKLTRLLQDSLGGNSQTLMIACVSPSDRDFMETLNTLKYANRTRNIKNKVQINQDQSSRTICQLRREIAALQMELLEYKQGKRSIDPEGNSSITDTCHENAMLMADNRRLQQRLKAMQETINVLTERNVRLKLEVETHGLSSSIDSDQSLTTVVAGYLSEIEKLQAKLIESEEMYQQIKKNNVGTPRSMTKVKIVCDDPEDLINLAKKDLEKNREVLMSRSLPGLQDSSRTDIDPDNLCESDDSASESDDKTNDIEADLNDINSDIEIKTKLIEQLELSQQRMQLMRQHYEEKLNVLNCKILNTQKERDEVLANMGPHNGNQPNEKMKKVKDEYERKINEMQRELRKLQQAEREHARQQRAVKAQEFKLANLRTELCELKCIKTRLIRKMSEQTNRHKEEENRRTREIAQLRKEQRRQENTVKSLQAKMNAKDQILKRKTEEVSALRRSQRGSLSRKAAGRLTSKHDRNVFNARLARQNWENLNRAITHASRNKQVVLQLEKELERLMNERETLSHDLANICSRQISSKNIDLANEEDTIKSNLNYIQDNISQLQQAIMEFEEGKDSIKNDAQTIQMFIGHVQNVDEAKFLLERLIDNTVMFSCNSALIQNRLLEHEALLKEMQQESTIQQQLLQHFLAQNNAVQISDLFESLNLYGTNANVNNLNGSQKSLASNGTYDIPSNRNISDLAQQNIRSRSSSPTPTFDLTLNKNVKVRRRTAQPQDLLFGDKASYGEDNDMTHSLTQNSSLDSHIPLIRIPSAPEPLRDDDASNTRTRLPPMYAKSVSREDTSQGANDVFSRLAAGIQDPIPGGYIQRVNAKNRVGVPLCCTHIVSGHNKAVLSMKVDENILYTAAADRTVKVWDLSQQNAQHCLSTHLGPVIAVQNDRNTRLLFSASGPYVRVWDLRGSSSKPIRTLSSSGLLLHGNTNIAGVAPGESPITALSLGSSGNLYVASSDKVRIWEIKSLACIGKLSGGHQAAVMCVTSWSGKDNKTDFVATGSKDHYVKVFEVPKLGGTVSPLLNLEPPHYDGVQSLCVHQDAVGTNVELFSGSRDSGIKQWHLKTSELKQSLNNVHKGWVTGMAIAGNTLVSTCRGGVIRLWNAKTCDSLAEMKTDLMINDIVTSNQRVFIASGSGEVRIYRFTSQENPPNSNIKTSPGKHQ